MHNTPNPTPHPDPAARRSSVVPLASAGVAAPKVGTTDHVATVLGENPLARPTSAAFDLPVGATLDQFEVVGPLGSGGMATVFKAKDLSLGREVALKILPPALAVEPDAVARFKFEARAAAKLNHDHVARVFSFGESRGLHYIAFEFVDGRTLRELIDLHGQISPPDAVRYMLDTAIGLQHAAEKGVVHRDVKPSNIIITSAGRAKLIDMGLARSVDPHSINGQVTQSGMTLGTFDYISPEQAIDPRRADVRSDIYSLGCTFYHALTGRTPVPDGNAARKLAAHQTESPTDPRLINPAIPDELAMVLDRMMAKLPAHRQQSAADLIADLNRAAVAMGMTNVPSVPAAHATHTQTPTRADRNWVALLSLAGAVLALSVAVVVLVVANSGSPSANMPPAPWNDTPPPRLTPPAEPLTLDPGPVRVPTQANVTTTAELAKALRDNVPKITLAAGVYDLTGEPGAVLTGKAVELDSPDGGAVVKVSAVPRGEKATDPRPGGITFHKCEAVKLKGLRVEVAPGDGPKGVGLFFHDVANVDIADCRFMVPSSSALDGAILAFARTGTLSVRHGFFQSKGLAAMELSGGAKAEFTECGFIAGRAALDVTAGDGAATVGTSHVTFLLNNSAAAVHVLKGGRCDLTAGHTLFAAPTPTEPGMMTELDRKAVVIRSGDSSDANTFTIPEETASAVYRVEPPTGAATATVLTTSPWAPAPKFDADNPFTPLELNAKLPPVRVGKGDILGVRQWNDRRAVYTPWPLAPLVRANEVVWFPKMDPAEKASYPENVYADLRDALNALKGKGTLLVRGRGVIPVPSVVLDTGTKSITVKPDEDSAPVLTPAPGGDRRETTLFRLEAGELKLDGLHFSIKPGRSADAASVVSMSGGKRCELKRCVVTMDEGSGEHTAVASLADVGKVMVKEFTDQPAITLDTCLIRGRGRVVRADAAVSATVNLTHVGVITEGAPAFDFGPATRSVNVNVNLNHVTAALAGPLLDLRGGRRPDDKPMVKLELQAVDCLFAAQDKTAEPLLRVTALDPTVADRPLAWSSTGGNVYDGWATFVELLTDDTAQAKKWDAAEWRKWSGEAEGVAVGLKKSPASKAAAKPADLEPADTTTAGATLKLLAALFPE